MQPQQVTVPTDEVSLHRWVADRTPRLDQWDFRNPTDNARQAGVFGERLGQPIRVSEPGTVTFPPHVGDRAEVHVVAWHEGAAQWYGGPLSVDDGDTVSIPVPIAGVLSEGSDRDVELLAALLERPGTE